MKEKFKIKGQLRMYMQWPLYLSALLIAANTVIGAASTKAGIIMAAFTLLYIGIAVWLYTYRRRLLMGGLVEFSAEYSWMQKQLLTDLELPYGMADENGRILWGNTAFSEVLGEEKPLKTSRKNIMAFFPEITKEVLKLNEGTAVVHVARNGRMYRIRLKAVKMKDSPEVIVSSIGAEAAGQMLVAVYLFDETEILTYKQMVDDQKMVAGLIYLDNYDEALESVEEVRRSLLTALIDRKITKYITNMNGIVKKLEKDKYFIAIKQSYITELKENRFSILEEVKTVNIGNEMAVTLSIGLGMNGESYYRNYDFARIAIDMALGRGGDQAVIKDGERIQYFGGKAQQVEKTTRVKARVKAHALRELMETKDRLMIMGHRLTDIDAFGAAVGIYRIATAMDKKAHIIINEVTTSVRPMLDRFVGNPDYPDDLFLTGAKAAELADANTLLVVVDVNRPSITDAPELLRLIKTIVVLDHHRQSSEIIDNAVLSYVEPYASSSCEMVAEVLQYIADGIKIKSPEADALYAGIVIDTNNFTNQTGVRTFEAAAFLRRNGADVVRVRKMFRDNLDDYKAKAEAIRDAEIFEGCFAISVCSSEGIGSPTVIGAQAANELLDIAGIKASIVITDYNHTVYISARSIDEVNVQVMMEKLGGGGHRTIAGAQLAEVSIEEAKIRVKAVIKEMLEKGDIS
ncbi:DHH family phosphoesterase [Lacrimispora saccharolytica]|uniref:Cyclic-di-AMP phosphodiesterase n=1 Tax=Lacrimispora saccharolytica (strain ATCC 35040 / DSM 2544 / NRCC 2533 / WM1) TaxID=610130 RepID=D9R2V6_LACSW|nr:DHH family phosphoesterase [Lacrimispora saccharolytica]ADL02946.1 phosphoesterase RecJ domain protein [[Clostridium] saccharolyticum WM1]QRV18860.1 DHH family phosphoesterase [Lacrimispora saccharolytica]